MVTSKDVDAIEERLMRMAPNVDVMTVNVLRREIAFLRDLVNRPCPACIEAVAVKKEKKVTAKKENE